MADAPTTTATTGATEEPEAPALSESSEAALARLQPELGDAIIEHGGAFGGLVVRVRPDAWRRTAQFCKQQVVARDVLGQLEDHFPQVGGNAFGVVVGLSVGG